MHQMLCTHLGRSPSTSLDLGCGTGRGAVALASHGIAHVTCCDPDAGMLQEAKERLAKRPEGFPDGTFSFHRSSAEDTGLADGSFDVVTSLQAWHWFDHRRAFAEVARVLRRDGGL